MLSALVPRLHDFKLFVSNSDPWSCPPVECFRMLVSNMFVFCLWLRGRVSRCAFGMSYSAANSVLAHWNQFFSKCMRVAAVKVWMMACRSTWRSVNRAATQTSTTMTATTTTLSSWTTCVDASSALRIHCVIACLPTVLG